MRFPLFLIALSGVLFIAAIPKKTYPRAKPPQSWDTSVLALFPTDGFVLLEGTRPLFTHDLGKEKQDLAPIKPNHGDFDRTDMMKKLERAEQILAESLSSPKTFASTSSKIETASDLIVMMGKTLFSSDPDYSTDDSFLKQAEEMTNSAKQIVVFVKKKDYEGASRAFSNVRKSCDTCHEGFR